MEAYEWTDGARGGAGDETLMGMEEEEEEDDDDDDEEEEEEGVFDVVS